MKTIILSLFLCVFSYALEFAPVNFGLRDLALQVSQECGKSIIISSDVKNMSVDLFIPKDISPDTLFDVFTSLIESKGLYLNDYGTYYLIDEKKHEFPKTQDMSNVELTMKVIEINNEKVDQSGFNATLASNIQLGLSSADLRSFSISKLFTSQYSSALSYLETNDYLKITNEPFVLVGNGQTVKLNVGDSVSVKTSSYDATTTTTVRNTYTQKDLGLTIQVSPKILDNGMISLSVVLTDETLKKLDSDGLIQTAKKSASDTFFIKDGGSVAIGGLTSIQDMKDYSKIPVLGDIPFLEYLFKYESVTTKRRTLTLFIQVRVIK